MESLRVSFNRYADLAAIAFQRLLELPILALCAYALTAFAAGVVLISVIWRLVRKRWPSGGLVVRAGWLYLLVCFIFFLDQRINLVLMETRAIRAELARRPATAAVGGGAAARPLMFDLAAFEAGLRASYLDVEVETSVEADAIDYIHFRCTEPRMVKGYIAVVDLTHPAVKVVITPEFNLKRLTSEVARKHDCVVAINGETGLVASRTGGLAHWTGNWIVRGEPILLEDTADRPFMSFDRRNRGHYFPAKIVDQRVTAEKYNTIWGRFDLIVDGTPTPEGDGSPNPRTCMGLDAAGETLVLFVNDGRRPGHSLGLGLDEVAAIMQLLGVRNAMSCDEGGTSCFYLASRGGIASVPSDGKERVTHCHFGIALE